MSTAQRFEREQVRHSEINQEIKHFIMQGHVPLNKQASKKLVFCGNSVRNLKKAALSSLIV